MVSADPRLREQSITSYKPTRYLSRSRPERSGILKGMGAPTSVGQPLNAAFLIAIEDLVARLTGIPNSLHRSASCSPASRRATNCSLSSITEHSFQGIHFLLKKRRKCNPCVRCVLSPMSQVAHESLTRKEWQVPPVFNPNANPNRISSRFLSIFSELDRFQILA